MSAESLTAGGTGVLTGFGAGGTYSFLLVQFTSLFFVTVIRYWMFQVPS